MSAGARGHRGRGGGRSTFVQAPTTWRATTTQACGLFPFSVGASAPTIGVPIGRHLATGTTVCCDPASWFQRARLISNPSAFLLGLPGYGKSALAKRMLLGLAGYGVTPIVGADLKGEYLETIRALGGQVISIGRGRGHLNVLDATVMLAAAERLTGRARGALIADARGRRHTMVSALLTLLRRQPPSEHEDVLLDAGIAVLDERHQGVPVLADLVAVLRNPSDELREVAIDHGNLDRYRDVTDPLVRSLTALLGRGRLGEVFASQTTVPMLQDRPVVFDVSSIDDADTALQAAALLASWSQAFGAIEAQNALADAGAQPQRTVILCLDELWRSLRGARGLVEHVDAVSRLNRAKGVATLMITHTLADLESLESEVDVKKAQGFVERAGLVICGGLPDAEMEKVARVVRLTEAERDTIVGWQDPPAWDADAGRQAAPPGQGCFLIKSGGRPGIPVRVQLTSRELALSDTDQRWRIA